MKIIANDKVAEVLKIAIKPKNGMKAKEDFLGSVKTVKILNGKHEGEYACFSAGSIQPVKTLGYTKYIAYMDEVLCFVELDPEDDIDFI